MPVIVYKTLDVEMRAAMARRIECGHCTKPFTFIHSEMCGGSSVGVPLLSSDDSMRQAAGMRAVGSLRKLANRRLLRRALCPWCKRYQPWMLNSPWAGVVVFGLLGGVVAAIAMSLAHGFGDWKGSALTTAVLSGLVGALIFGALGYLRRPRIGPHKDRPHPESMRDEEMLSHFSRCEEGEMDPFFAWLLDLDTEEATDIGDSLVSLGVQDWTGRPIAPEEYRSDAILDALERQARGDSS